MQNERKRFAYALYCLGPKHLPVSYRMKSASKIRSWFARRIMASAGKHINIERGASFTENTSIGSNSCIGINCRIQEGKVVIGNNVLMGPDVLIFTTNHESARTDIPICMQGNTESKPVVIEDDVWIGARVIILPGVTVRRGCIDCYLVPLLRTVHCKLGANVAPSDNCYSHNLVAYSRTVFLETLKSYTQNSSVGSPILASISFSKDSGLSEII